MKKWYVITGILAVLWLVSLGTCSSNSAEVDRVKGELADARAELSNARVELERMEGVEQELEEVRHDLARLEATKEINFGNGLKVFGLKMGDWGHYGQLRGKVQNVSDKPMKKVYVVAVFYDEDGSVIDVVVDQLNNLYPQEVGDWSCYGGLFDVASYAAYAFGNRSE